MKRNNCLSLIKVFACIGVVFIHVPFPGLMGNIFKYISLWAVPFFLMIAGYYSFERDEKKISKRCLKIVKILILGYIIYLSYNLLLAHKDGVVVSWLRENYNWKSPFQFVLFCTIQWAIPLWYLIAMAETYLFWIIVIHNKKNEIVFKYIPIMFAVGTLLAIVVDTFGFNWSYKTNFICRALPWFLLGYIIRAKYDNKVNALKNIYLLGLIIIGWIVTVTAIVFNTRIDYSSFGVLFTAPAIFLFGIKNKEMNISRSFVYLGDKVSLYVYIFHVPVSGGWRFSWGSLVWINMVLFHLFIRLLH